MISFTINDTAALQFIAQDGNGNPIDLTGASLQTTLLGPQGTLVVFNDSKHSINPDQTGFKGYFTLNLLQTDTAQCAEGENKDVLTQVTQGSSVITYRGIGVLNIYPVTPAQ